MCPSVTRPAGPVVAPAPASGAAPLACKAFENEATLRRIAAGGAPPIARGAPASEAVKTAQTALIALGHLTGRADGKFGPGTEAGVLAFQQKAGIPKSGVLDAATVLSLDKTAAPKLNGASAAPASAIATGKRPDLGEPRGVARKEYARGEVAIIPKDLRDVVAGKPSREPSKVEQKLLAMDFDDPTLKLGAKGNSTNPGVLVQEATVRAGRAAGDNKVLAKLKSSVAVTPCTTSSVLAYPQMARLLKMDAEIPPAIIRSIEIERHKPIYKEGLKTRIAKSWQQFPAIYAGTSPDAPFVMTKDGQHFFGALSKNPGGEKPYGAFNGPMEGVAYSARYEGSVSKGAAFAVVSSPKPLAAQFGGKTDLATVAQKTQYARDMADMFVLDALFNQQDRPGNIATVSRLAVPESGKIKLVDPEEATDVQKAAGTPINVLMLKDNDGGVSWRGGPRTNRSRNAKMLEKVRHMHPDTYKQIQDLRTQVNAEAGAAARPIRDYFVNEMLFSDRNFDGGKGSFVENLNYVADVLKANNENGTLMLDADLRLQTGVSAGS